ncbi:cupin domain-containing protein [Chryseobacterium sp. FH1]|uniref:cupin domain-containing protein n=1 Tax=Chryseobacterium sp. FH1 TaxID=1233951 RepID=UPI000ABD7A18|nr:cupin domain-containing protein [Chryseobacterium sp. FH1]
MKRRNFITTALLSIPAFSLANLLSEPKKKKLQNEKPYHLKSNESRFFGKTASAENLHGRCIVSSADTDSQLYISSASKLTNAEIGGPALHIHHQSDEIFFVASGEFLFQINDDVFFGNEGDTVFVPKGVPHTFANPVAGNPGNLVIIHQPINENLEKFYELFCKIGYMNEKILQENISPELLQDIMKNNVYVGPPIDVESAMKNLTINH